MQVEGSVVHIMKALAANPSAAQSLIEDNSLMLLFQMVANGSLVAFSQYKEGLVPLHTIQLHRHAMQVKLIFAAVKEIQHAEAVGVILFQLYDQISVLDFLSVLYCLLSRFLVFFWVMTMVALPSIFGSIIWYAFLTCTLANDVFK